MKPRHDFGISREDGRAGLGAPSDSAESGDGISYRLLDRSFAGQLQAVNRACAIASDFTIRFDREPDFFAWPDRVFDGYRYLGVLAGDRLVGFCLGGFRTGWLGDGWGRYVYAGDARVLPEYRGYGYATQAALRIVTELEAHADVGAVLVSRGNRLGEHVLDRCRRTLGVEIESLGSYDVFNLALLRRVRVGASAGVTVRPAGWHDLDEAAALMTAWGTGRLFAPRFDPAQLRERWLLPGLGPERHFVAERSGRMVGTIGVCDMFDVRQVTVLRYAWTAAPIRAIYGIGARLGGGAAPLPRPGGALRGLVVVDLAVAGDDPGVLHELLATALNASLGTGCHVLQVAFLGGDPLRQSVRGLMRERYAAAAHVVFTAAGAPAVRAAGRGPGRAPARAPHFDLSIV